MNFNFQVNFRTYVLVNFYIHISQVVLKLSLNGRGKVESNRRTMFAGRMFIFSVLYYESHPLYHPRGTMRILWPWELVGNRWYPIFFLCVEYIAKFYASNFQKLRKEGVYVGMDAQGKSIKKSDLDSAYFGDSTFVIFWKFRGWCSCEIVNISKLNTI